MRGITTVLVWALFTTLTVAANANDAHHADLLGADADADGVRDDYQAVIAQQNYPDGLAQAALKAGKVYGQLMATVVTGAETDEHRSRSIMVGLLLAKQCKRQYWRNSGDSWSEAAFFNTIDRVKAKFQQQSRLAASMGDAQLEAPGGDPCVLLVQYVE